MLSRIRGSPTVRNLGTQSVCRVLLDLVRILCLTVLGAPPNFARMSQAPGSVPEACAKKSLCSFFAPIFARNLWGPMSFWISETPPAPIKIKLAHMGMGVFQQKEPTNASVHKMGAALSGPRITEENKMMDVRLSDDPKRSEGCFLNGSSLSGWDRHWQKAPRCFKRQTVRTCFKAMARRAMMLEISGRLLILCLQRIPPLSYQCLRVINIVGKALTADSWALIEECFQLLM